MENVEIIEKLECLLRHIDTVQSSCRLLGKRLIQSGRLALGRQLIANSMSHDRSKFFGIEWDNLINGSENDSVLKHAVGHHRQVNPHHAAYWGGIENMPEVYIAELVCDLHARSAEMGTDLRAYIKDKFLPLHNMTTSGKTYKTIKTFVDALLENQLKPI